MAVVSDISYIIYDLSLDFPWIFSFFQYADYGFDTWFELYLYQESLVLHLFSYRMEIHGWTCFGIFRDETFQTLLQTEMKGDENITGGTSGLEGSVLLMAVSLISLIGLYLFLQKKFNPVSQPAPGRI